MEYGGVDPTLLIRADASKLLDAGNVVVADVSSVVNLAYDRRNVDLGVKQRFLIVIRRDHRVHYRCLNLEPAAQLQLIVAITGAFEPKWTVVGLAVRPPYEDVTKVALNGLV